MTKRKYPVQQTDRIDDCECVYCGYIFNGSDAMNGDMDKQSVTCPKCYKDMFVSISVQYTCTPMEEE
jgi:NAD-dependent SIR2 family protein deacetylase